MLGPILNRVQSMVQRGLQRVVEVVARATTPSSASPALSTDAWVAQQLRETTPFGVAPKYLVRDNDAKDGPHFGRRGPASWRDWCCHAS